MLKVLITGANGQLGQAFKRVEKSLQASNICLVYADRAALDISNMPAVEEYFQQHHIDIVVNTAAYTAVDLAEGEPELAQLINVTGAENLAQICNIKNCWLVHISTDYVFNGEQRRGYVEEDVTDPQSVYGATKLAGELAILQHCPQALILRTSWVFSEFGNNFLKTMLRLSKTRRELSIVADQHGAPTYAPHIAEVVFKLIEQWQQRGALAGLYHFSGAAETNWARFAAAIFKSAERVSANFQVPTIHEITTSEYPTAASRPQNSSLNCDKLYAIIGGEQFAWETGIRQSIEALASEL